MTIKMPLVKKDATYKVVIWQDQDGMNPRTDMDNLTQMVCFHRGYTLGDEHTYKIDDYASWKEFEKQLRKDYKIAIIKPLYLYDHSGITISTAQFNCRWDSGQVGFIFIDKDEAHKQMQWKRISKKRLVKLNDIIDAQVTVYDQYLTGDVYGFSLVRTEYTYGYDATEFENEEVIDSCGGFYGTDKEQMKEHVAEQYRKLFDTAEGEC